MRWPRPPPPGVFCATPYHAAMRDATAQVQASVVRADWPAPPGVHALTTLRGPAGDSQAPFDWFSFGLRNGGTSASLGPFARPLQSMSTGPRSLRITLPGCRSRCSRPVPMPYGAGNGAPSGTGTASS